MANENSQSNNLLTQAKRFDPTIVDLFGTSNKQVWGSMSELYFAHSGQIRCESHKLFMPLDIVHFDNLAVLAYNLYCDISVVPISPCETLFEILWVVIAFS